ncbi:hypothetical protein B6A27_02740 [Anoxybacillus sp. UARK-01]|uniref:Bax inhibitor-1/YccA family protein n=1 Tax=Anoxybacillus sp. UARK-01 TaxID=1895648 RepID=UPI0009BC5864|nr:Bax inhibitor-1/YccA family protein [Anoxybacillus sp. UARK-01]OQM47063.1 hypothetical protein B6A27_02740 [Anoxybacillus sp. UARK-01]
MNSSVVYPSRSPVAKLAVAFLAALAVATGGLYVGQSISTAWYLPLYILEVILLLVMIFSRRQKMVGYPLMFAFMFVSGATLAPVIGYYVSIIGAAAVFKAFALAVISFSGVALYAAKTKEDFSFLGGFLTLGAFALLGLLIVQWFIPFSSVGQMGIAALGILIFLGFTIYDINRLARHGFSEADIPMIVVNIYLDFINLFIYILRFFASDED